MKYYLTNDSIRCFSVDDEGKIYDWQGYRVDTMPNQFYPISKKQYDNKVERLEDEREDWRYLKSMDSDLTRTRN